MLGSGRFPSSLGSARSTGTLRPTFWPCIDPGNGFQRYPDGTAEAIDFTLGETVFNEITADDPMLHDLENKDDHLLRFVAIELKDL